jgi:hypothetical protein
MNRRRCSGTSRRTRFALALLLVFATQACGNTPRQFNPLPAALGDLRGLALGFEGLLPLRDEEGRYAVWVSLDNRDIVGLGPFNVDDAGRPINPNGEVIERFTADRNLFSAVSVLITIEPGGLPGATPGQAAILQGPFIDGVAQLSVPAPILVDQIRGSYRVFTPTDGPDTNEGSGVWAVSVDDEPLLALPPLNNVYAWEHYMIINGQTLTMGRFLTPTAADFANPFSGPEPAPEFPGEDFLVNAPAGLDFPADLGGARLLLTLEPRLNDTADPSQLVVLEAILPAGLQGGEIIEMTNRTADFPTGTAVIY